MGRRKKPGSPGKTTIPMDVVRSVTKRLAGLFRKSGYDEDYRLFIIPQQGYLYLEVEERRDGDRGQEPPLTRSSTTHKPLGRLRYDDEAPEAWVLEPYKWSDEIWDEYDAEVGTPEQLMLSMIVEGIS